MTPERWKTIDELVDAAMDLPEFEREPFLSAKCAGDTELKNEVLALLNAQSQADNFLERSAMGVAAERLAEEQLLVAEDRLIGRTVGTYRIESLLGSGGMGQVYLAYDQKLSRRVALKILPPEYVSSDERVKRFQIEARAVSALNHPNIVTIYDVGSDQGINYIATEYVEGKTFRELIGAGLRLKDTLNIVIQVCEALSAAHRAGITHRDIKPENIIMRPDGYVKILDFGLAKLSEIDFHTIKNLAQTAQGVLIGTPAYMSPEQVADEKVDHRTDLWSIGVVLFELLTKVNPFKKSNRQATFQSILSEDPPLASSYNPEISPELDQILVKALEKDADLSYQTASDLRADLRRVRREFDSNPSLKSDSAILRGSPIRTRSLYFLLPLFALFFVAGTLILGFLYIRALNTKPNQAIEWVSAINLQITQSPWVEGYPSLSPDGKNIVFASETNGDRNIYLQRVGGKNLINLTPNSKENDTMPSYSPDGKFIAFRSERNSGGIFVMEETGENIRQISDTGFHPSWSPDNKKIVVSDKSSGIHTVHTIAFSSLYVIDVVSGEKNKIETGGDAIMPSWSPNGDRIAFWFVAEGKLGEIATVPAQGGEPVIIASDAASDWNPVWSPDGKFLYFASDRGGNMNLWRIPIDEKTGKALGEPESISTPSKYCRHITISKDGKTIGYVRYESQSNLQTISFDPKTLQASGEPNWVTRGDREISHPSLSPDQKEYVIRMPSRTQEDLGVINIDGSNLRVLTNDRFRERQPLWTPDGKKILFQTDRSGKYQIWMMNPDGSESRQITFSEKTAVNSPVISPDGSRLAFTEIAPATQSSFIMDLTKTWQEQTLEPIPPFDARSFTVRAWSPDGRKLLYNYSEPESNEFGIGVYDFETRSHQKIIDRGSTPVWLNDSRHFIFGSSDAIFLCDSQTRKTTELYKPFAYEVQQAGISADNKTIYFRYLQVDSDVWLMESSQN